MDDGASATRRGKIGARRARKASKSILQRKEVQEMLLFAVPALGMVLADPLMSLIDTACVGHVSALQLAALGPNTAIFNFVFQLFAFLGVATTSTIASNSPKLPGLDPSARAARLHAAQTTLSNSLCLALVCGALAMAALLTQGPRLLAAMGTPAEVVGPALQYLRIRALAAPAVMIMSVSQGACLGQQDAWTPAGVLAAAGLLNAAGDMYLIANRGLGVAGAAAATTAAQIAGAVYFLWHLWRKGRQEGSVPLRFAGLSRWQTLKPFLEVGVTLFGRTIFGMAAYFCMTAAATRLGMLSTATHQVAMQVFWFLLYIPEPLSLAAQSLIARDRYHPQQASQWAWLLLHAGVGLGFLLALLLAGVFTFGARLFTSDVAVQSGVAALVPVAMVATHVCSTMMMFDGISIGAADFGHLPVANAAGLGVTLAILWASGRAGLGLQGVWWSLVGFYATRLVAHVLHFLLKGSGSVFGGGQTSSSSGTEAAAA